MMMMMMMMTIIIIIIILIIIIIIIIIIMHFVRNALAQHQFIIRPAMSPRPTRGRS